MQRLPFACHGCHSRLLHMWVEVIGRRNQRNMSHLCCSVDALHRDEVCRSVYRSSCFSQKIAIVFCNFFGRRC
jgi:hypothetical protein